MIWLKWLPLMLSAILIAGCNSAEDKIVDLSGGVFIVYVALVSIKLASPKILKLSIYKRLTEFMSAHIKSLIYPLYLTAVILILTGFWLADIHRVLVFTGFVLAFIAYNISKLSSDENNDNNDNKVIIEIVTLGLSIIFVLFLLWGLGANLFKGL